MGYDLKYWNFQKQIGNNKYHSAFVSNKFQSKIKKSDKVLDFGCGGGYVLNSIVCASKFGIEVNDNAIKQAMKFDIKVSKSINEIKNEIFDVVISNSVLEHVSDPLNVLRELKKITKKNGKLIISVPHEDISYHFESGDINQHLFTWSPMSAGNLVAKAGFKVEEVIVSKIIKPPLANHIYSIFGLKGYKIVGRLYRSIRKLLIPIKNMGVSGDIIVYAKK